MKTTHLYIVFAVVAITGRLSAQQPGKDAALAIKGLDPVALVTGKEMAGDKAIALDRGGFRYLFASNDNRAMFEREPARFEIQNKGYCGAMPGVKGNPALFAVVKGRIFVFGSADCRAAFTSE